MSEVGYEFERAQPLGCRTCDVCGEWLADAFWSLDECHETIVQGEHGELDTMARRTYELRKFCSIDCGHDAVLAFLNEHNLTFEGDGPGLEPASPCAGCGVPVLRLVEHSAVSLLRLEQENHVVEEQVLAVLCPQCGGLHGDDGDDDPGGEPVVPMPTLLAA